jgi:hypothetical protein
LVFFGRSPDKASLEDVCRYHLHLASNRTSIGIMNAKMIALRYILRRDREGGIENALGPRAVTLGLVGPLRYRPARSWAALQSRAVHPAATGAAARGVPARGAPGGLCGGIRIRTEPSAPRPTEPHRTYLRPQLSQILSDRA